MVDTSAGQEPLSDEHCWDLLRAQEFGRLAYVIDGALDMSATIVDSTGWSSFHRQSRSQRQGWRSRPRRRQSARLRLR